MPVPCYPRTHASWFSVSLLLPLSPLSLPLCVLFNPNLPGPDDGEAYRDESNDGRAFLGSNAASPFQTHKECTAWRQVTCRNASTGMHPVRGHAKATVPCHVQSMPWQLTSQRTAWPHVQQG